MRSQVVHSIAEKEAPALQTSSHLAAIKQWWILLGGGLAWFIQFLVLYGLAEFGGVAGWQERRLIGVDLVAWGVMTITLAAFAVAAGCAWMARQTLHDSTAAATDPSLPSDPEPPIWQGTSDPHFLVRSAVVGNAVFALIIIAQSLPVFFF